MRCLSGAGGVLSAVPLAWMRAGAGAGAAQRRGAAAASGGPGGGKERGVRGETLGGTLAAVGRGAPVVSPRRE